MPETTQPSPMEALLAANAAVARAQDALTLAKKEKAFFDKKVGRKEGDLLLAEKALDVAKNALPAQAHTTPANTGLPQKK